MQSDPRGRWNLINVLGKSAPAVAITAALSTFACCLPLGFAGALGLAGISVWADHLRPWLLAAAFAFLCLSAVQLYFRKSACIRRSRASIVFFGMAAAVVILVVLFPQTIASLLAGG